MAILSVTSVISQGILGLLDYECKQHKNTYINKERFNMNTKTYLIPDMSCATARRVLKRK